jgi:hypothetical protein
VTNSTQPLHLTNTTDNEFYEIRAIPGKGYGCFAKKALERGTRILADDPLLSVPMADYMMSDIKEAFGKLSPAQQELYFTLHSGHGQDAKKWPSYIHPYVVGKERARIQEQHEARVGAAPSLISIFQINCMEKGAGAAVFPHAARFNHCCNPNASFSWNSAIGKETIHIMNAVEAGHEITISYCDMVHDSRLRTWELSHYGFTCDCPACGDEDDETSFAYSSAQRRFRLRELESETKLLRGARLEEGARQPDFVRKLLELAATHQGEGDFSARLADMWVQRGGFARRGHADGAVDSSTLPSCVSTTATTAWRCGRRTRRCGLRKCARASTFPTTRDTRRCWSG